MGIVWIGRTLGVGHLFPLREGASVVSVGVEVPEPDEAVAGGMNLEVRGRRDGGVVLLGDRMAPGVARVEVGNDAGCLKDSCSALSVLVQGTPLVGDGILGVGWLSGNLRIREVAVASQ